MILQNKVAIITGSSRGIGKTIAQLFAREGASVVVNAVSEAGVRKVCEEIEAAGGKCLGVAADVSKAVNARTLADKTLAAFGHIDILVNNAGISRPFPLLELSENEWDAHMTVNVKTQFLCCQAVAGHMISRKSGKIINISSVAGHVAIPNFTAYSTSKGAVLMLTRALAVELGKYNINVNSVSPGLTMTDMSTEVMRKEPDIFAERVLRIPLRKVNDSEDIANAVLFLASAAADRITGQDIAVDGGCMASHPGNALPKD